MQTKDAVAFFYKLLTMSAVHPGVIKDCVIFQVHNLGALEVVISSSSPVSSFVALQKQVDILTTEMQALEHFSFLLKTKEIGYSRGSCKNQR